MAPTRYMESPLDGDLFMRALTIRPPYSELAIDGIKKIEIRPWNTGIRDTILIHAGKTEHSHHPGISIEGCTFGALIGTVELRSSTPLSSDDFKNTVDMHCVEPEGFDLKSKCFGWRFWNPVKFDKPVPYKGQLGFFKVPKSLLPEVVL